MVLHNAMADLSIIFSRNGRPDDSATVNLKTSLKCRTWAVLPTNKIGDNSSHVDQ